MTSTKVVTVSRRELEHAFEFVNFGAPGEHTASISVATGKICWHSMLSDLEEEDDPDEDDDAEDYISVPHKNDLGLGSRLVLRFAGEEMPSDYDTVATSSGGAGRTAVSRSCCNGAASWNDGTISKNVRRQRPCSNGARRTTSSLLTIRRPRPRNDRQRAQRFAFRLGSAGSKLIRSFVPVALANRSNVRVVGWMRPPSSRATTACVVPIASATCSCVMSASPRALIRAAARANSSSSAS
jgi:hypothetical protein